MPSPRRVFVFVYTMSGAAALVYEVTWTRLLTLQLGHTVSATSIVLAAFMGGLAVGAALAGRRPTVSPDRSFRLYAVLELVVAAVALLLPFALHGSVPALAWAYADGAAPARFAIVRLALSFVLVGVPAAAMGATFPVAVAAQSVTGASAALLYAANTIGAAFGAVLAGFVLIPVLGLRGTTWIGVALNVLAAGGAFALMARTRNTESGEPAEPAAKSR